MLILGVYTVEDVPKSSFFRLHFLKGDTCVDCLSHDSWHLGLLFYDFARDPCIGIDALELVKDRVL